MDTSNILIPVGIIMLAFVVLWRLKSSGQNKDYSNTLLKVREKRQGSIYSEPQSTDALIGKVLQKKEPLYAAAVPVLFDPPADFTSLELINYQNFQISQHINKMFRMLRKPHPLLMSLSKSITDAQELLNIVKSDPELVAMVLNMANSPFFGLRKAITDINHAVIYLGITQVKNLATQFAISQSFAFETAGQQEVYNKIWKTGFLASTLALFVAREANLDNPSELSTRCLLSYLGDVTLLSMQPSAANFYLNSTPLYLRIASMQRLYNSNPAVLGGIFAQHLKLPEALHQGIGLAYQPLKNDWCDINISPEEKQSILFCFSICRLAEYFILEVDAQYTRSPCISYVESHKPELFYLTEQLEGSGLGHLNELLKSPRTKMKLSQMISNLHRSL